VGAEGGERVDELLVSLAEPDHQPGLGHQLAFAHLAGEPQDAAGALKLPSHAGRSGNRRGTTSTLWLNTWAARR